MRYNNDLKFSIQIPNFLSEEKCDELIKSGVGTVIVSIDGVSQNVYEQYRIGGKVEKVFENISYLNEANKKYGNHVALLPQFIVFEHNYHEVEVFKKFCEDKIKAGNK